MTAHRFPRGFYLDSKTFGVVTDVRIDVSVDMIDTTAIGSQWRTTARGQQRCALSLTLEADRLSSSSWIDRIGEVVDVDEVLGDPQNAYRIRGSMMVNCVDTGARIGFALEYVVRLNSVGPIAIDRVDPTVLAIRRRIAQVRAAAGLT